MGMGYALSAQNQQDIQKADLFYQSKRYELALPLYKQLLMQQTDNQDYLYRTGFCFLQTRQYEQAVTTFTKLHQINYEHTDAILQLAYTYKILQRHRVAKTWYDKLADFMPKTAGHLAKGCEFAYSDYPYPNLFTVEIARFNSDHADFYLNLLHNQLVGATTHPPISKDEIRNSGPSFHVQGENNLYYMDPNGVKRYFSANLAYSRNVGPLSFARSTGLIAYSLNKFTEGVRQVAQAGQEMSLYFAYLTETGSWIDHVPFPFNSPEYACGYPYLTPDGETLYFASDMPGGYGGFDIYVCYYLDGSWTIPHNLGPRINTPGDEISPFFDGNHLYFSSDWHYGYGGLDIFRADFSYESWNFPINLGPIVNSSFDDFNYVYMDHLSKGYFCSDRPAQFENENIYEISKSTRQISIKLAEIKSGTSIAGAEIDLSRCGMPVGISDEQGLFTFEIYEGFDCYISINKVGYTNTSFRLKYADIVGKSKTFNIRLNETANFFWGQIFEDSTGNPLKGVYISAVNELDGELQENYSDADGKFALHIKPLGRYHISFAKSGFNPQHYDIKTSTKVNPTILGTLRMRRANNVLIDDFNRRDDSGFALTVKDLKSDIESTIVSNIPSLDTDQQASSAQIESSTDQLVNLESQSLDKNPNTKTSLRELENKSDNKATTSNKNKDKVETKAKESSIAKSDKSDDNRKSKPASTKSEPVTESIGKEEPSKVVKNFDDEVRKKREAANPPPAIKIEDTKKETNLDIAGYVIQVAAFSKKSVDIAPFKYALSSFGTVYVTNREDNLLRVMVGVYQDRLEAEDILDKIRRDKFKEAFITPLPKSVKLETIDDFAKDMATINAPKTKRVVLEEGAEEYMINLGHFKNMMWFDNRAVEKLGLLEERKDNGKILVLLSGYLSKQEAENALVKVKELGYKSATVVKNGRDGKLIPVP